MKNCVLLFVLALNLNALYSQDQIGNDIRGEDVNDDFGSGVAINHDGTIVAIGIQRRNSGQGVVEVYHYQGGEWVLMGDKIVGIPNNSWFGKDVALDSVGTRLIVGSYKNNVTKIYDFVGDEWVLCGEISLDNSQFNNIHFGHAVDITPDGQIVAISATHYPQGNIHKGITNIYKEVNNEWIQLGEGIEGESSGDQFGWDISLSREGDKIAIGAIGNDNNGEDAGQVRVFTYRDSNWHQIGQSLRGEQAHLGFGFAVSMSGNGQYVVVGAPIDWTGVSVDFHYAEIYEMTNDEWVRKGDRIYGNVEENFGTRVQISDSGDRVAVSVPANDICPIQIFDFEDNQWNLTGAIKINNDQVYVGQNIAMNPNGDRMFGTSPFLGGFGKMYSLEVLKSPMCVEEQSNTEQIGIYIPNVISRSTSSSQNAVFFAQSKNDMDYRLKVYNRWGRLVFENDNAITNHIEDGWSPNDNLPIGVYVYLIFLKEELMEGEIILMK